MATVVIGERMLEWSEPDTLLSCLEQGGIDVQSSCRVGACQTCLLKAINTNPPAIAQVGLRETWKEQGLFLPCMCSEPQDIEVDFATAVETVDATLVALDLLAPDVVRVRFRCDAAFDFRPGQFLSLIRADGLTRPYSIASVPADGVIELHVRRVEAGRMSNWLHGGAASSEAPADPWESNQAALGVRVRLRGPQGDCFYVEGKPDQPLLLVGTGTGLAPLIGIARDALAAGHSGQITLLHGGRIAADLYLDRDLQALALKHANFRYWPALSGPSTDARIRRGRVDAVLERYFPNLDGFRIFLCGSPSMVKDAKRYVYKAGAEVENIFADSFLSGPALAKASQPSGPAKAHETAPTTDQERKPRVHLPLLGAAKRAESEHWSQRLRFAVQALVLSGFLLQGVLYYVKNFRPLGNLLPFMAYDSLGHMVVSSALIAWTILFLLVLVFGRFVCGWLCPLGFMQDAGERLLKLFKLKLRRPYVQPRFVRVLTSALVLSHFVVTPLLASPVRLWQLDLHFREPWLLGFPFRAGLLVLDLVLVFLVIGLLLPYFFGPRAYCKMVCETGYLLDLTSRFSFGRIRRNTGFDQDTCLGCKLCTNICPQGIAVHEEVHEFDRVVNTHCITCVQCVSVCPNGTIVYSLSKRVADTGRVAGYLANLSSRAEDFPRFALTGLGVLTGAYVGFRLLPPSYFHSYVMLSSLGGLAGFLIWQSGNLFFGDQSKLIHEEARSLAEREREERILPLDVQEKLATQGPKTRIWPKLLTFAGTLLAIIIGVKVLIGVIPKRVDDITDVEPALRDPATRTRADLVYLGVPPMASERETQRAYARLGAWLEARGKSKSKLGQVSVLTGASSAGVARALAHRELDAAFIPAGAAYSLLSNSQEPEPGVDVIAITLSESGAQTYTAAIVTKSDGPATLAELKGQRLALTSFDSVSGHWVPARRLARAGVRLSALGEVVWAESHDQALALLEDGQVDAAASNDAALVAFRQQHPTVALRVLASEADLPNLVLAVRTSLEAARRQVLLRALLDVFKDSNAAGAISDLVAGPGIAGLVPADVRSVSGVARWLPPDR